MRKEIAFTIEELRRVCITCPHCKTEVVLDLAAFEASGERMSFTPRSCPACRKPYDTALRALDELQSAYASLAELGPLVTFRAIGE